MLRSVLRCFVWSNALVLLLWLVSRGLLSFLETVCLEHACLIWVNCWLHVIKLLKQLHFAKAKSTGVWTTRRVSSWWWLERFLIYSRNSWCSSQSWWVAHGLPIRVIVLSWCIWQVNLCEFGDGFPSWMSLRLHNFRLWWLWAWSLLKRVLATVILRPLWWLICFRSWFLLVVDPLWVNYRSRWFSLVSSIFLVP